ncbi:MAG: Hsp33 family molecular chaperone HslO [Alphaproteobacteria bacterium]
MTFEIPGIDSGQDNKRWGAADDNVVQTFQIETSQVRGRLIRLGRVLDDILQPHGYPAPVAQLVAETVTLALLLSSMLKYEGIFTLQTKGDGPVSMLVADVTTGGDVRACAKFDADKFAVIEKQVSINRKTESEQNLLVQYLGQGYIAFTVDQGNNNERYQGIVELKGASLADCVHHYFNQSEQITTGIKMAVRQRNNKWRAGGIMIQRLPGEDGQVREDQWDHATALVNTCKTDEFLDPDLHSNELLVRLFHEDGVRVFTPANVRKNCRCNTCKIEKVLLGMSKDNIEYLSDEGIIAMDCEFCNAHYTFETKDILSRLKQAGPEKET